VPAQDAADSTALATANPADARNEEPAVRDRALRLLGGVELQLEVILGGTSLSLEEVLELREGAVIGLDRTPADLVQIVVGDRVVARGEIVTVDDELAVRVVELLDVEAQGQ
jgi:flagellar motor switch protein FliN/FliY